MNLVRDVIITAPGDWENGWGHMWGWGGGWMWLAGLIMMLVWLAVIVLAVWLVARAVTTGRTGPQRAREILAERYARGEISRDEYAERLDGMG
jgi:putative membrane protein